MTDFSKGLSQNKSVDNAGRFEFPPPLPRESHSVDFRRERLLAVGFASLGVLTFGLAALLNPYDETTGIPRSFGTHQQLGLPACAFQMLIGRPCPSCGMTTSLSLLMHADPVAAWRTNWAGCFVAALGIASTTWFIAVAAGLPPSHLTADEVVKWTAVAGMAVAGVRWLGLLLM